MQFRDSLGQPIDKGDLTLVPTGFGQTAVGTVTAVSQGLDPQQPVPMVQIAIVLTLAVEANGVVAGVVKIPKEQ